jgi:hypothetical protein
MALQDKIRTWYQGVLAWLGTSEPGGRKATVEDTLSESVLKDIVERLWEYRENTSGRKRFPQVLIDGSKPSDRNVAFSHGLTVPSWGKVSIDEWVSVTGKGVSLNFFVTEVDLTEWVLRVKWVAGEEGFNLPALEWEQLA